ncbi:hypothetical protein BD626DRAFT_568377 [Schizophyllum amplum]|uniref:Uncharacterized protein n=1 Tax=Schizophyllum amplum TaxID=97359 RepID=A0A550CG62_9AGAR|nr:hypothetical protein BD626DRAFT_568377 [Auriculariopsis ampla]
MPTSKDTDNGQRTLSELPMLELERRRDRLLGSRFALISGQSERILARYKTGEGPTGDSARGISESWRTCPFVPCGRATQPPAPTASLQLSHEDMAMVKRPRSSQYPTRQPLPTRQIGLCCTMQIIDTPIGRERVDARTLMPVIKIEQLVLADLVWSRPARACGRNASPCAASLQCPPLYPVGTVTHKPMSTPSWNPGA